MEGLGTGREEDTWDDDSAQAGTRVPAPQPTRESFPVTKSAQTDDNDLPSFPSSD
jgi:hypothetical protein